MKTYTPAELLSRLEWRREIRNILGRISHDYAVKRRRKFTPPISVPGRTCAWV